MFSKLFVWPIFSRTVFSQFNQNLVQETDERGRAALNEIETKAPYSVSTPKSPLLKYECSRKPSVKTAMLMVLSLLRILQTTMNQLESVV